MLLVFASRNGAGKSLPMMIESLRALRAPAEGFEIIAVNSASDDATGALLCAASDLPLTVITLGTPGKNRALNAALDHARGRLSQHRLVVFTDDDVRFDPNWLIALEDAAQRAPEADIFGGRIDPLFHHQPDAELMALEDEFNVLFARSVCEEGYCRAENVFGPNMAVRAKWFALGLRFDVAIGPNGSQSFAMGSETELLRRLERAGAKAWHAAAAKVWHLIQAEEMTAKSVVRRARRHGAGFAQMLDDPGRVRLLFGAPIWVWRGYLTHAMYLAVSAAVLNRGALLRARYRAAWFAGALAGSRLRKAKTPPTNAPDDD